MCILVSRSKSRANHRASRQPSTETRRSFVHRDVSAVHIRKLMGALLATTMFKQSCGIVSKEDNKPHQIRTSKALHLSIKTEIGRNRVGRRHYSCQSDQTRPTRRSERKSNICCTAITIWGIVNQNHMRPASLS